MALREDIRAGQPISAGTQRQLHREVNRLGRVRGGRGISVTSSAAGLVVASLTSPNSHLDIGIVTEVMGTAVDGSGRQLSDLVWYKVRRYGRPLDAEIEIEPERIMRAFAVASPALLFAWEVGQAVPLMIVPKIGEETPQAVWIIASEAYDSEECEEA